MVIELGLRAVEDAAATVVRVLEDSGRSPGTVLQYRQVYQGFLKYLAGLGGRGPGGLEDADLVGYVESATGCRLASLYEVSGDRRVKRLRRPLGLLQVMVRDGRIDPGRVLSRCDWRPPAGFEEFVGSYLAMCRGRGNSEPTVDTKLYHLGHFVDYLTAHGVGRIGAASRRDVTGFLCQVKGLGAKSMAGVVGALRDVLAFARSRGETAEDLAAVLPRQRYARNDSTPYLWSADEVKTMLGVIDRASAIGKRDYAMLLLTARLGLRTNDMRCLELGAFDWRAKTIRFTQRKTGRVLELPLLEDVGWAVIDYVRDGRPETPSQRVFVRHRPPFDAFGGGSGLLSRLRRYARIAGIEFPAEHRHGMHSLRSSLARTMLSAGTGLPVISGTLGHRDSNTTAAYYLRFDTEQLRLCACDVEDVLVSGSRP